jgi:hypothetical protein
MKKNRIRRVVPAVSSLCCRKRDGVFICAAGPATPSLAWNNMPKASTMTGWKKFQTFVATGFNPDGSAESIPRFLSDRSRKVAETIQADQ